MGIDRIDQLIDLAFAWIIAGTMVVGMFFSGVSFCLYAFRRVLNSYAKLRLDYAGWKQTKGDCDL